MQLQKYHCPFRRDRNRLGGSISAVRCLELEHNNLECVWLKIIVNNKSFYFCYAYRPPNSNNDFWDSLNESIEKVKDVDFPNFFIVGDLNDNYMIETCRLRALVNNCNLRQLINEPTREPSNASLTLARLLATILSWQVVPFLGHELGGYRIVHD